MTAINDKTMNVIIGYEVYEDFAKKLILNKKGMDKDKIPPEYVIQILNANNPYLFYPSLKYAGEYWYLEKPEQKIKLNIRRDRFNYDSYFAVRLLDYLPRRKRQTMYADVKEIVVNFLWYRDNLNI